MLEPGPGRFPLSVAGRSVPLLIDAGDHAGVVRAANDLRADLARVTGAAPAVRLDVRDVRGEEVVLIGTVGRSALIDRLVRERRLDVSDITGRWETFLLQVIERPLPDVPRALVIAGSDRRGTIYGIYDLSAQIGVSPWYWWADVPVRRQSRLYVLPGRHRRGEPAVKYRGFFINDEAPALAGWAREKFGGFNHRLYERVFELLLRMKGNYLWPAMWGNAFYDDDPLNAKLADEYGVVIGTSHHEPLMRAHDEWRRYGSGAWNYETNAEVLRRFWRESIERMGTHESIVTIGMRGDGDRPMSEDRNIALLQQIVADQRQILSDVAGTDASTIPQIWALYKEVQDYYDRGMRVPDDVTLLFSDDNWGNIRRLPRPGSAPRAGGYGVYYHFDYVGGPRNYKWLNTNQIERVWQQMHHAYRLGASRIWIVNVGDIKPMEFPLEFFLDYAWDPERWPAHRLPDYTRSWAERQFGAEYAGPIADILAQYTRYNSRRKPELLAPETYSLTHYREAGRVVDAYNLLAAMARHLQQQLPTEYRDAFYQLVLHPVLASATVNELYVTVARNRLYAKQGRAATNALADRAVELFAQDARISAYYNDTLAGGKWRHMMDQTHIGYTSWQQPPQNTMPAVTRIEVPVAPEMGVAIEGSDESWPAPTTAHTAAVLPELDVYAQGAYYIDVFNRGQTSFDFATETAAPWLHVTPTHGVVRDEQRLEVSVDWSRAPSGRTTVPIAITGAGRRVVVQAPISNPSSPRREQVRGFMESNGYVSIEAEHYSRAVTAAPVDWLRIPNLGRTLSGVTALPVTAGIAAPGGDAPHLEYDIFLADSGTVSVHAYLSPSLDVTDLKGLRYGMSLDDEAPQVVNMLADTSLRAWEQAVSNNVRMAVSRHHVNRPGEHVLKFWLVDPGVVLQKLVVDAGGLKPSYLGPPESFNGSARRPRSTSQSRTTPAIVVQSITDAVVRLPRLFQDGMVLQRDTPIPVWGRVSPATAVTVELAGRWARANADASGSWSAQLPEMPAGGPHTLTVEAAGATLAIRDVMIGDVWIASGQSNMEWPLEATIEGAAVIAAANDPLLREFAVPHDWSETPDPDLQGGSWAAASPEQASRFSAVGYYFARDLRATQQVPIGIIHTSWGGSNIETWMSRAALRLSESEWHAIVQRERAREAAVRDSLRARIGELPMVDAGLVDGRALWAEPSLDDASWAEAPVPSLWENAGYAGLDGTAWYRTTFSLTNNEARQGVRISLGTIDDDDITWVNGIEVGRTQGYAQPRVYHVPASALRPGINVLAVRVADGGGGGGLYGDAAQFHVEVGSERRSLAGTWRFRVGSVSIRPDGQRINKIPTVLYNGMLHPLQRYPIKGVIWYQGESNANNDEQARAYGPLFTDMIRSWRREWSGSSREFPFLWVQLPNFGAVDTVPPVGAGWAYLREAQAAALELPRTGQVVTIDVGDAHDLHPRNKEPIGQRLAQVARRIAYGEAVAASGPKYRSHTVRGGDVVIELDDQVVRPEGPIRGFAVAGADQHWVWADARIEGNRIIVSSPQVPRPIAVRYAWSNSPQVNLFDRDGLPLAPFRTDRW